MPFPAIGSRTVQKPRPTDLAWAAGILDGEGSIGICVDNTVHRLFVTVTNSDRRILNRFVELFAGYITRQRDCWSWRLEALRQEY